MPDVAETVEVLLPRQCTISPTMDPASNVLPLVPISALEASRHFTFPLRTYDAPLSSSNSMSQLPDDDAVRHTSPQRLFINPLPAFEFNPSSSGNVESGSPVLSRMRQTLSSYDCVSGHRRNDSEMIGGNERLDRRGLLSTSLTRREELLTSAMETQNGNSSARRGHAHRRSGAVSIHDLSDVFQLPREPKGSSPPTTPTKLRDEKSFPPSLEPSIAPTEISSASQGLSPSAHLNGPSRTQLRTRVGFSDTIEVIPRRLSTISSETSSSLSTIHASHSVSGSVTSILSSGPSSPPRTKLSEYWTNVPWGAEEAELAIETTEPCPDNRSAKSINISSNTMPPQASPLGAGSTLRGSQCEDSIDLGKPNRPITVGNGTLGLSIDRCCYDPVETSPILDEAHRKSTTICTIRPRTSPEMQISKRQRKVKTWAGSMLSRKAASISSEHVSIQAEIPAKSLRAFAPSNDLLDDISFDEDTTCVIRDPSHIPTTHQKWSVDSFGSSQACISDTEDVQNPIFDLDAALEAEPDDRGMSGILPARRRMHSSGALGRLSGPATRYHRRAESAPEMPPLDYHTFGFPRLNSNPKMADVFEEDEEQQEQDKDLFQVDKLSMGSKTEANEASTGLAARIPDKIAVDEVSLSKGFHSMLRALPAMKEARLPCASSWALADSNSVREAGLADDPSVEIVEADEEPRSLYATKPLEKSFAPALSNDDAFTRPASAPIKFALPKLSGPYQTPEGMSSVVSSPDFTRTSFDVPRLHTATSSNADWATGSSGQTGELGLSLWGSVDDVPSLTSSGSSAHRLSSQPVAIPRRTRLSIATKRSSLASLSRLVGSSSGERSTLNLEEHASPETAGKVGKKKASRISRIMRLWKSKERISS